MHKDPKLQGSLFNTSKRMANLLFEMRWVYKRKSYIRDIDNKFEIRTKLEYACDLNAWVWLNSYIKHNKYILAQENILPEQLLVREFSPQMA